MSAQTDNGEEGRDWFPRPVPLSREPLRKRCTVKRHCANRILFHRFPEPVGTSGNQWGFCPASQGKNHPVRCPLKAVSS